MDSRKTTKGNDSKSSSSSGITMAVRFNVGDEQVEDIVINPPPTAQSATPIDFSPIQNNEDFNWRKEFLSSNFFHRKRSGSIEGDQRNTNINISSSSIPNSNIINNSANNDTSNAVGTWKLIKGKLSQGMEDINWSKNSSQQQQQHSFPTKSDTTNNDDSDTTVNSSISDELSLDTPSQLTVYSGQNQSQEQQTQKTNKINQQQKLFNFNRINNKSDSESDINQDILTNDDNEPSTIRKSLANLRSKAKSTLINNDNNKKDDSNLITSNTIRNTFLRKRKKQINNDNNEKILPNIPSNNSTTDKENLNENDLIIYKKLLNKKNKNNNNKRDLDNIESGVEMFEDMIIIDKKDQLNDPNLINDSTMNGQSLNKNDCEDDLLKISFKDDIIKFKSNNNNNSDCISKSNNNNLKDNINITNTNNLNKITKINIIKNSNIFIIFIFLFILIFIPINDFFRGIITCLFMIQFFNIIWKYVQLFVNNKLNPSLNISNCKNNTDSIGNGNGPEKTKFEIPNYNKMKYIEVSPNIEEHKPLKSYSGWMNEINNYDPANYHISLTRSVYIRLDGSILRISNTSTRIPKRSMWNEHNIDRKNIIFTSSRCFNLLGCRVEMLPRGLARKRYFSRKYPIQLVIKNNDKLSATANLEDDILKNGIIDKALRLTSQQIESGKIIVPTSSSNTGNYTESINNNDSNNSENNAITTFLSDEPSNSVINNNDNQQNDFDFSTIILNADLQKLHEDQNSLPNNNSTNKNLLPCGDETRILLFARDDREKEDWYRRFYSASIGDINDQELCIPDIVMISDDDIAQAIKETTKTTNESDPTDVLVAAETTDDSNTSNLLKNLSKNTRKISTGNTKTDYNVNELGTEQQQNIGDNSKNVDDQSPTTPTSKFEGLLLSSCSARNSSEYIKFMSTYQKACSQSNIPVVKTSLTPTDSAIKRNRRQKRQEDELWKGIEQTLYLGPSGSVVWANVLIGRILFSCLNDTILLGKIQEFLQKKLSAIRLPSFMEDVSIAQVHLGDTPPLIHRISQPQLDERGIWIDADVTYEGLVHMTITTKLNLLRLKRSQHHNRSSSSVHAGNSNYNKLNISTTATIQTQNENINNKTTTPNNLISSNIGNNSNLSTDDNDINKINLNANENSINPSINNNYNNSTTILSNSAIYDSNAESSGASSSDSESTTPIGSIDATATINDSQSFHHPAPGSSRRLLRIVDRITASNLFQSATEISYIQRAMENMSTKITLRVELKGLVSRVVINIPPPPSDRIWIAFRGPPRLWISAKPAVGDHTFDWSIVTNVIENKLCDEVYKYLVYPNMVDIIVPFLGQSTYKEE